MTLVIGEAGYDGRRRGRPSRLQTPSVGGPKRIPAPSTLHQAGRVTRYRLALVQHVDRVAVLDGVVAPLAVHDVLVSVLDPDCVAGRAAVYEVVAAAADQHVLARAAGDHVVAGASLYPVTAGVAVEGVLAAEALYEVAEGLRFIATETLDAIGDGGPFEGVGVGSALAISLAGLGDSSACVSQGQRHPGAYKKRQRHGSQQQYGSPHKTLPFLDVGV